LFQHGKGKEGKAHAETAAKLDPESREAKLLQGLIARQLREYVQAEQYFQSLHHESPADMSASNQLALVLVEQADAPKQKRALQLALVNARLAPESAETLSTLGWIYQRLGRLEEAERALRAAVKDGDASAETNYYLAHVLIDRGRPDEARPLLSSALRSSGFLYRTEAQECLSRLPAEEVP
jgi:tetratricopeptide (TPR) repeat protein